MNQNNALITKEVNFNKDTLVAVKKESTGKIYVAVNHICNALGLDCENQKTKLRQHATIKKGTMILGVPSMGGNQNTFVIELDFLPIWLATINPSKIKKETQNKLIEYQLKAKDVLAQAFIHRQPVEPMPLEDLIILQAQSVKELKIRVDRIEEKVDTTQEKVLKLEKSTACKALSAPADDPVFSAPPVDGLSYLTGTQIAKAAGIYSIPWLSRCSDGRVYYPKPHGLLVNALAMKLKLKEPDCVVFFRMDGDKKKKAYRYSPLVVEKIRDFLKGLGYPDNLKVNGKSYRCQYAQKDNVVSFPGVGDDAN